MQAEFTQQWSQKQKKKPANMRITFTDQEKQPALTAGGIKA
jgi:hypothetical protein